MTKNSLLGNLIASAWDKIGATFASMGLISLFGTAAFAPEYIVYGVAVSLGCLIVSSLMLLGWRVTFRVFSVLGGVLLILGGIREFVTNGDIYSFLLALVAAYWSE